MFQEVWTTCFFDIDFINIEQLYVPIKDAEHYYNTGEKRIALVTGSCASVTISAITVQCVMDLINKYKNYNFNTVNEDLYRTFRMEYDRRIDEESTSHIFCLFFYFDLFSEYIR